ncbi:MAG: hypothetical protein H6621_06410 [Halobacteriovoraceae bacterium]|nr:hypothetical protein [Halobacteriovoraceae bacterium]
MKSILFIGMTLIFQLAYSNDCILSNKVVNNSSEINDFNADQIKKLESKGYTVVDDEKTPLKLHATSRCIKSKRVNSYSGGLSSFAGGLVGGPLEVSHSALVCVEEKYVYSLKYDDKTLWRNRNIEDTKEIEIIDSHNRIYSSQINRLKKERKEAISISRIEQLDNILKKYSSLIDPKKNYEIKITHLQNAVEKLPRCEKIY